MENQILKQIRFHAITNPDAVAIQFLEEKVTYRELEFETNHIAMCLKSYISKHNEPVVIYQRRGVRFIEYMLGVMKSGCCYIPVESEIPLQRLQYILSDSGSKMLLSDELEKIDIPNCECISIERNKLSDYSLENIQEDDLLYIMYTSGTSGVPKGVKIMYSNLINLIDSFWDILYCNLQEKSSIGVLASFSFDASVKQIYNALYFGHKLVISEKKVKFFGRSIHAFHTNYSIDVCDVTPSILEIMIRQRADAPSNTRFLLIGGENLRWETLKKYNDFVGFHPTFINLYGPTECCVDVSYNILDEDMAVHNRDGFVSIGCPVRNTVLRIVDADGKAIEKENIPGELLISGEQVGAGYINIKSNSFVLLDGMRTYYSGDIAMHTKEGIVITGRKDDQVKIHGNRVELNEINEVVEAYWKCNCVTLKWETGNKEKIIVYACKSSSKQDENDLIDHLKGILPHYMISCSEEG